MIFSWLFEAIEGCQSGPYDLDLCSVQLARSERINQRTTALTLQGLVFMEIKTATKMCVCVCVSSLE